jgi:dienelactone hydrolase
MTIRSMIVALLPLFAVVAAQQASADEKLIFKSTSFKHLGEALSGVPGEPVDIKADLRFPPATENRVPAVVVLHTIGGYRESNEGWHSEQFRKAGFATLTYESISVRGINDAPTRGAAPLWGSLVADGFNALKALAAHPRIDASRIAVTGYSMGGEATRLLAFERLRRVFVQDDLRFAAHVAVYPCHVWGVPAAPGAFTGAPVLEQLGGADDCGPVAKAERYYDYLNTMGHPAPVRIVVYPGAPHSWTDPWFATERFYPNHASPSKCPLLLIGQGGNLAFDGGKVRSLDGGELGACLRQSRGYTQGFQPLTRDKSTADAIAFFRQAFGR